MTKPPEIWNSERLEQAMLDEAASHGASQRDLALLREQFRIAAEDDKPTDEDGGRQAGDIPD